MAFWAQSGDRVEHRRGPRLKPEGLRAHYWTGGISPPEPVLEISLYGALIAAPGVYCPGTLIRISLEDAAAAEDHGEAIVYAGVWGKVLRCGSGGFCVEFVFENRAEQEHFHRFLDQLRQRGLDETNGNKTEKTRRAVTD